MEVENFPDANPPYIRINGFRFSYHLFAGLTMVTREDRALRITNTDDGIVTVQEKVVDPDFWLSEEI